MSDYQRQGCIYKELHNHGRTPTGRGVRRVRGVGTSRVSGYRWVAEISYFGKRYRCRSYNFNRVAVWLSDMREKLNN